LPEIRARSRPGTAIAAMMPMIATTIRSSMSVKPLLSRIRISVSLSPVPELNVVGGLDDHADGEPAASVAQMLSNARTKLMCI
jgi:hypothetical protein